MPALTALGTVHTIISLVALASGVLAFKRHGEISPRSGAGKTYLWTTVVTCLTGFGIFQHGGFGPPHALGVITLVLLAAIGWIDRRASLGRLSPYAVTVGYSLTFFFHMVPAVTETLTRLPSTAPVFASSEDPAFQTIYAAFFLLFLAGAALQVLRLRQSDRRGDAQLAGRH